MFPGFGSPILSGDKHKKANYVDILVRCWLLDAGCLVIFCRFHFLHIREKPQREKTLPAHPLCGGTQ